MSYITNITHDVSRNARQHPEATAIICRDTRITYKVLDTLIWRGSSFLHSAGIRVGDIVGVYTDSDLTTLILMLSISRIGATVVSLPQSITGAQMNDILCGTNPKAVISDINAPIDIGPLLIRFSLSQLTKPSSSEAILDPNPKYPWIIVSGSGTTGKPKLIPISHEAQFYRTEMSQQWLGLTHDDVVASLSHLAFHAPKNRLLETLQAGAAYYLEAHKERDLLNICNTRISVLHATVFHVYQLLARCDNTPYPLKLKALTIGGSNVPFDTRQKIREKLTSNLIVRYASNETGPISCIHPPDVFVNTNSVGKPLDKVQVSTLNQKRQRAARGDAGLIAVKSPGNFNGYLNDSEANRSLFVQEGFILGDLARIDGDGSISHLGRADFMMIFNGINIYPSEIESALLTHPALMDAASIPICHPVHQDIPVAAVSLKPGAKALENEILEYCKLRLGSRSPHQIFILKQIPRNERGKVQRLVLADTIKSLLA